MAAEIGTRGWHALRYSEGRGRNRKPAHALRSTSGRATQCTFGWESRSKLHPPPRRLHCHSRCDAPIPRAGLLGGATGDSLTLPRTKEYTMKRLLCILSLIALGAA